MTEQKIFNILKKTFTTILCFILFIPEKPARIKTDALDKNISAYIF